jgi:hypothetical protein
VSGEDTTKELWDKLGDWYQSNALINKVFLWKNFYNLRMKNKDLVTHNLYTFNIVVIQLFFVDINISNEHKCISLLGYLQDSWDIPAMAICSNTTTLSFDDVVSSLFSKGMMQKNMEGHNTYALFAKGKRMLLGKK